MAETTTTALFSSAVSAWPELSHVLACNGVSSEETQVDVMIAARLTTLEAFFGELPRVALLPPLFPLLNTIRLVHQVGSEYNLG